MSFLLNFNYTKERVFLIEKQKSSGFIQIRPSIIEIKRFSGTFHCQWNKNVHLSGNNILIQII